MAKGYYKEVAAFLKANGYVYKEPAKGSHEKWAHEETGHILIVPRHLKSRHTANSILKTAGVSKKF
ncbi:MAG: type II toxin-antitoxin system HicA family toxin [Amphiplicatus sp.]